MPLYGRGSEVSSLQQLIDGVDGRGGAVVISRRGRIGKSTLLEAATRRAQLMLARPAACVQEVRAEQRSRRA